jgi:mercuric ion transport protein
MKSGALVKLGVAGSITALLCCFTPVVVILLAAVGLSAMIGWLDYILMPALAVFVGITVYALWRRRKEAACCAIPDRQPTNPEQPNA